MNTLHAGIITLMRSALNGESLTLPEDFDWNKASKLIYEHHLTGLAVSGASLCGVPRSHPAVVGLTAAFCKDLQVSRGQMKAIGEVFALFDANGIHYMPIKGAVIKALYPRPEYRIMGDADVFIRMEQYPKIRELLTGLGMKELYDSEYEIVWESPSLKLELHCGAVFPKLKKYYNYYGDGWRFARKDETGSGYHLSAEDHYVYFLVHFAKHYLLGTICAKDICDFWVWKRSHPDMDEAYILRELDCLELRRFHQNVLEVLDCWFGGKPANETVERITDTVFSGGVSGEYNESSAKGAMERYSNTDDSLVGKKIKWFFNAVFPDAARLSHKYAALKKWPVLLPVFWVAHWFSALFVERDRIKRGMIIMKLDSQGYNQYSDHLIDVGLKSEDSN